MLFSPLILRYTDSFTVNLRFASSYYTPASVRYGYAKLAAIKPDDEYAELFYEECRHEQKRAAAYLRDTAQIIREEFPDPRSSPVQRAQIRLNRLSGWPSWIGVFGPVGGVEPDPNRFAEPVEAPTLVTEGSEAGRIENEYLPESAVVL